ncbi:MAG: di-trans,poly-cis-decaprenylcistransferase [Armatimonadetes bacterium]|nr:di-trans,poly-cis-decaprenylcistransferase [Armatimonadota bacterium]
MSTLMSSSDDAALEALKQQIEGLTLPRHLAIIMDGNGRWAQQRGLPRTQGHLRGRATTRLVVQTCSAIGIEVLSLYAFSAENWRRSKHEVEAILDIIEYALREEMDELDEGNVQFRTSGRVEQLPPSLVECLREAEERLASNTGLILNLCVNYGGRAEIVDAARRVGQRLLAGELSVEELDEEVFAQHLYQPDLPDPDVILRPGGEMRISNFLLWQSAYAEIIVMPVLWPDFREEHLGQAIVEFNRRQRRFGGVPEADASEAHRPES